MQNFPSLTIDTDRLWQSHMEMGQLGATPKGGVNRQALTAEDQAARALFSNWAKQAGCTVDTDAVGNLFARRPGRDNTLPAVCTGSHLDTQPTGDKFDGAYGVLAGVEVIRALNDAGIETLRPVEVIAWTNEESTRFAHAGSAAFTGMVDVQTVYDAVDPAGIRFEDALQQIEAKGDIACGKRPMDCLFEAHIEQGPLLEKAGLPVGIVTGARGQSRYDVTVTGMEGHAGTMPMDMRSDALAAAARLVISLEAIGQAFPPQGVCTVGAFDVYPNSRNTIPGSVRFAIDLRHPTADGIAAMDARIRDALSHEQAAGRVSVECRVLDHEYPITFDTDMVDLLREQASNLGIPSMDIFSMAGHDACYLAGLVPTAMLFVPCKDGLSHNELEDATADDLAAGTAVLGAAMLSRAMREKGES